MALTFECPGCNSQLQLPDELAGQVGQCPKCKRVMVVPSPHQPRPVLVGEDKTASDAMQVPAPPPPAKLPVNDRETQRPRRSRPLASSSSRPVWPWIIGGLGVLFVLAVMLSCSLFLVSGTVDQIAPPMQVVQPIPAEVNKENVPQAKGVRLGRLEGNRVKLKKGVFQIQTELSIHDEFDPDDPTCRCKRYEITLQAGKSYVMEQESQFFDCIVRVEKLNREVLADSVPEGMRDARLDFMPQVTDTYVVFATCQDPAFGAFTLTIREQNVAKPRLP